MTDRELLERFVSEQDEGAFRTLIERHGRLVYGVCRSVLREPHDVEDAFQNTFLHLVRRAESIKNGDVVGAWLHRVALRVALRARTRAGERRERERRVSKSETEMVREASELIPRADLYEELSRLPERHRVPLILCYLEGRTNEEAATRLGCPVGTIKGRLSRARQQLRDRLERRRLITLPQPREAPL